MVKNGSLNVELNIGNDAHLYRSAGFSELLLGKDGKYYIVRLAIREMRKIIAKYCEKICIVSN